MRRTADARARRRLWTFLVVLLLGFAVIGARLGQVQVLAADRYLEVGEQQRVRTVVQAADRGSIFDREGRDLALSVQQQTVWANPRLVTDPLHAAGALAPILGTDAAALRDKLSRDAQFVYLARKVDDEAARKVKALALDGVFFLAEPKRFLPAERLATPLLGKVGTDNEGLSGLERQYDKALKGRPGLLVAERDPHGRDIAGGVRTFRPSARGDDLVLTIDRSLQYETERALGQEIVTANALGGIAIVMATGTGEILALANMTAGANRERGAPVMRGVDPGPASSNMAVTNVYEPGSVNKMITIAGTIEEGLVRPSDELVVPSTIQVADHLFSEHDPHPTEKWSVTEIMANSSNVGSIMLGQRLGKLRLDRYLRQFGFGSKSGLGFPGESSGLLLDPKKWSGTSLPTMSIGQGVAVTALQMLAAYNTVANGGVYVAPKLVRSTVGVDGKQHPTPPSPTRRVLSPRTATQVTGMLTQVVEVGTGKAAAIEGYSVAGKTGTARKPLVGVRGYKEGAYVSSFAGFVPAERPALTAIVMMDEPTPIYGGLVAAPVFAEVSRYGLRQFRIPPPPRTEAIEVHQASPSAVRDVGEVGGRTATTTGP